MKKPLSVILAPLFALLFLGCQKDDICPETTETTPLLLIEFFDAEDPETLRVVEDLSVYVVGETEPIIGPVTTNNIELPLRTDQSFTEYRFVINSDTEQENEDWVRFDYLPTPTFLNRACGFKINYMELTLRRDLGPESWIVSDFVIINDIQNETATHIHFTH